MLVGHLGRSDHPAAAIVQAEVSEAFFLLLVQEPLVHLEPLPTREGPSAVRTVERGFSAPCRQMARGAGRGMDSGGGVGGGGGCWVLAAEGFGVLGQLGRLNCTGGSVQRKLVSPQGLNVPGKGK